MKTYTYHLFLRNPLNGNCKVQDISVDCDDFMDFHTLIDKLRDNKHLFDAGYTLVGMNVGIVVENQEEK